MTEKTRHVARPVNKVSDFHYQVDIIVPYHGQYELLTKLMESIFRLTRSNYYKLYVVDDCSPNASFSKMIEKNSKANAQRRKQPNLVTVIRNEEQKGFAGACKVGYEAGESPYVCFINSDCKIEDTGWLRSLGETLLEGHDQGVRVVAPVTNNACGGDPAQEGDKHRRLAGFDIIPDDSCLSLYCFLCHRQLFPKIGGFLKEYPYGYYEDEEFAARLRKHGYKQAVSRQSWVHHVGMATIKSIWRQSPPVREIMEEENRERCIEDLKAIR